MSGTPTTPPCGLVPYSKGFAYLHKPFTVESLTRKVREVLDIRRAARLTTSQRSAQATRDAAEMSAVNG